MSWTDDFDNSSLDSTLFGTSVAGNGTVTESGSYCTISGEAAVSDAAIVYLKAKLDQTINETFAHRLRVTAINAGGWAKILAVADRATAPAVDTASVGGPTFRIQAQMNSAGGIFLSYYNTAGVGQYWTGSAFSSTPTPAYAGALNTWYTVRLVHTPTQFYLVLLTGAGAELARTTAVNFSALKSTYANLWVYWGDIYTDAHYSGMDSDSFSLAQSADLAAADSLGVSLIEACSLSIFSHFLTDSWDVLTTLSDLFLDTWIVIPIVQGFEFPDSWDVLSSSGMQLPDTWRVLAQDLDPDTDGPINVVTLYGDDIQLPTGSAVKT